jgi:hypothetical protein
MKLKKILAVAVTLLCMNTLPVSAAAPAPDGVTLVIKTLIVGREDVADEYDNLELLMFSAEKSASSAVRKQVEMMNRDIEKAAVRDARTFERNMKQSEEFDEILDIRAYPVESENYLQLITTSICYPTYGTDGDVWAWVYDRTAHKYLRLSDALIADGLTEDVIINTAEKLFEKLPRYHAAYLYGGEVAGFYMDEKAEARRYILKMTEMNPDGDPWDSFFVYTPAKYNGGKPVLEQGLEQVLAGDLAFAEFDTPLYCNSLEAGEPQTVNYEPGTNDITFDKLYSDERGNSVKFLRDGAAVIKLNGKAFIGGVSKNGGAIHVSLPEGMGTPLEGTLVEGKTLYLTADGIDYTLVLAE